MIPVVTVHYGSSEITRALLLSLESYESISRIVTVLHNEYQFTPQHRRVLFLPQQNLGFAAGVNRGLRYLQESGEKSALVLNPDVSIKESQIQEMMIQEADCIFPAIREGSQVLHGYDLGRFGTVMARTSCPRFYPGTCFMISISAWEKSGGMNEEYFHYFEDFDFCLRLQNAGCKVQHVPTVIVDHIGKSGTDYPNTDLPRYAVRNHLRFLRKLGSLNILSFTNVALRHLLYLLRWRRSWRGFRAWYTGLRESSSGF